MLTHAFTSTGPYAILIVLGVKRVENRGLMPSPVKGRCAISCSKSFCREEYGNFVQWASRTLSAEAFEAIPAWREVKDWPGAVIGACGYSARGRNDLRLADNAQEDSPALWDEGYGFWWDLDEVVRFDQPIPCRGNVGMWRMPEPLAEKVSAADILATAQHSR